jgi:hypothetical protein
MISTTAETDWDAVRDQVAASVRAEIIILAFTNGVTAEGIISTAIRDAKDWADRGIWAFRPAQERTTCAWCANPLPFRKGGRPRSFCSEQPAVTLILDGQHHA